MEKLRVDFHFFSLRKLIRTRELSNVLTSSRFALEYEKQTYVDLIQLHIQRVGDTGVLFTLIKSTAANKISYPHLWLKTQIPINILNPSRLGFYSSFYLPHSSTFFCERKKYFKWVFSRYIKNSPKIQMKSNFPKQLMSIFAIFQEKQKTVDFY